MNRVVNKLRLEALPEDEQYAYRAKQGLPAPFVEIRARGEEGLVPWDGEAMGELDQTVIFLAASNVVRRVRPTAVDRIPVAPAAHYACGGVPADLVQVALPLEGGAGFGFLLTSLVGLDNAYPELRLADYLNDAGRQAVADLEADDCTLELLTDYPGGRIQDVTTTSPVVEPEWLARVVENRLGSQPIEVPVFQYHEVGDGLVAFPQADTLHREYCERGVVHTWRTYDTGSESPIVRHVNLVYQANVDVNAFIADRLAGTPAGTTC